MGMLRKRGAAGPSLECSDFETLPISGSSVEVAFLYSPYCPFPARAEGKVILAVQ